MINDKILEYMQQHLDEFVEIFEEFVELESPSHEDKNASDKCCLFLRDKFSSLGFDMDLIRQEACGDHLYGEIGKGEKSALFLGHYDTVYPIGTIKNMPFKIEDGKIFGPGVLDMKGGIIMTYFVLKALIDLNMLPDKKIGVFFNSDEESGSFFSSDLIVEKSKDYSCVLVMEPGVNDLCSIKTGRYSRGTYEITACGNAAHSGSNPHLAVSPLVELAKQLLYIEQLNRDFNGDVTLAPTFINGGIPGTCMVPETAHCTIDVRYKTGQLSKEVHEKISNLKPLTPGIDLKVSGKIDKPVMVGDKRLFLMLADIAASYDIDLKGVTVGGGSDGNFTSAAGIPTLDGLGMSGEFLHNPEEYVYLDHIPYRTALVAKLLCTL